MKTFLINLKKRKDRLEKFIKRYPMDVSELKITYGFDGNALKTITKEERDKLLIEYNVSPSVLQIMWEGELGCLLSHINIYKMMIKNNIEEAFILEDDNVFGENFVNRFETILNEKPDDFDILYLGGSFNKEHYTKRGKIVTKHIKKYDNMSLSEWDRRRKVEEFCRDLYRTTGAYIISLKGAKKLVKKFKNDGNLHVSTKPIDHWLFRNFIEKDNIYTAHPLLCYTIYPAVDSDCRPKD